MTCVGMINFAMAVSISGIVLRISNCTKRSAKKALLYLRVASRSGNRVRPSD